MKISKPHKSIDVNKFVEKIIGFQITGTGEPIVEHCTNCKMVRKGGRCVNNQCKYYDKTS